MFRGLFLLLVVIIDTHTLLRVFQGFSKNRIRQEPDALEFTFGNANFSHAGVWK